MQKNGFHSGDLPCLQWGRVGEIWHQMGGLHLSSTCMYNILQRDIYPITTRPALAALTLIPGKMTRQDLLSFFLPMGMNRFWSRVLGDLGPIDPMGPHWNWESISTPQRCLTERPGACPPLPPQRHPLQKVGCLRITTGRPWYRSGLSPQTQEPTLQILGMSGPRS